MSAMGVFRPSKGKRADLQQAQRLAAIISVPMHLHAAEHLHTPVLHMPQDGTRKAADTQRQADTQSQNISKFATPSDSVNSEQSMI